MRVQLLEAYEYLVPHEAGDIFDVPEKVAKRWFAQGLAKPGPSHEELLAEEERKAAAELESRKQAEAETEGDQRLPEEPSDPATPGA